MKSVQSYPRAYDAVRFKFFMIGEAKEYTVRCIAGTREIISKEIELGKLKSNC